MVAKGLIIVTIVLLRMSKYPVIYGQECTSSNEQRVAILANDSASDSLSLPIHSRESCATTGGKERKRASHSNRALAGLIMADCYTHAAR